MTANVGEIEQLSNLKDGSRFTRGKVLPVSQLFWPGVDLDIVSRPRVQDG